MTRDQLLDAMSLVDDDLVQQAGTWRKKPLPWKKWLAAAACLALVCAMAASYRDFEAAPETPTASDTPYAQAMPWGTGQRPALLFNGRLYRWAGVSKQYYLTNDGDHPTVYTRADGSSYLPEGCVEVGPISGCTPDMPNEALQLQADFETSGTVYHNPDTPEVVYALLSNTWGSAGGSFYIRFVTDALGCGETGSGQRICWQGRQYRVDIGYNQYLRVVRQLPEGAELVGTLTFNGGDLIPSADLETNCRTGMYSDPMDGREVWALPGDDSVIYVYQHHYWAGGDYPAWLACPLWE